MAARAPQNASPLTTDMIDAALAPLARYGAVALAVSGGGDSRALMEFAADWQARRRHAPRLVVMSVDHGLRPESRGECETVRRWARARGLDHTTLTWEGPKPSTGLQAAARAARRSLLARAAQTVGCDAVALAHTLDDQAETILMRLAAGSGLRGLAGMTAVRRDGDLDWVRPFLGFSGAQVREALRERGLDWIEDPSNGDARFERVRWRTLMPSLGTEGLDAHRLADVGRRAARADAALEAVLDGLVRDQVHREDDELRFDRAVFRAQPVELRLRWLARVIGETGGGTVTDAELERLDAAFNDPTALVRRTLGGALISAGVVRVRVGRAPPRRGSVTSGA
jgi:tRNA(Ile)-lysidine synthase